MRRAMVRPLSPSNNKLAASAQARGAAGRLAFRGGQAAYRSLRGACGLLLLGTTAEAAYVDKDPHGDCSVRVHYPTVVPSSADAFVLAVGTAMSRSDYDFLAAQMTTKGFNVTTCCRYQ